MGTSRTVRGGGRGIPALPIIAMTVMLLAVLIPKMPASGASGGFTISESDSNSIDIKGAGFSLVLKKDSCRMTIGGEDGMDFKPRKIDLSEGTNSTHRISMEGIADRFNVTRSEDGAGQILTIQINFCERSGTGKKQENWVNITLIVADHSFKPRGLDVSLEAWEMMMLFEYSPFEGMAGADGANLSLDIDSKNSTITDFSGNSLPAGSSTLPWDGSNGTVVLNRSETGLGLRFSFLKNEGLAGDAAVSSLQADNSSNWLSIDALSAPSNASRVSFLLTCKMSLPEDPDRSDSPSTGEMVASATSGILIGTVVSGATALGFSVAAKKVLFAGSKFLK